MSRCMTPKENFMSVLNGKIPESVVSYNMGFRGPNGGEVTRSIGPTLWEDHSRGPQGGKDIWGVTYVANEETGFASIPEPNNFILEDITDWRDVIKFPEVPNVDWAKMAEDDYAKAEIDRNVSSVYTGCNFMPFQQLIAFMGFNEGLCALYEEPEEVKDLLNTMTDFWLPIIENTLDHYKPDWYYMLDDTASRFNPFFSPEIYEDIFLPIYHRLAKPAIERGLPIGFHNCGHCEAFLDYMKSFGVKFWDPAQPSAFNDLDGIKAKYGRELAIVGAWEVQLFPEWPNVPEEEIIQSIKDTIDHYAPGGGYVFIGGVLGRAGDQRTLELQRLVSRTAKEYGDHWYEKH